ncbi:hypothetical protein ARMSODRAFT_966753 [Armillaria solidipes]|uniref:Uncharacterized protein n=1 Tax=Armillaria solidipes TaxID=1076256 RepID=A0A2H3B708_9AGAR|nr:hypothetical protein ARMSODRAFT_966753 [Armillaria solidipes]
MQLISYQATPVILYRITDVFVFSPSYRGTLPVYASFLRVLEQAHRIYILSFVCLPRLSGSRRLPPLILHGDTSRPRRCLFSELSMHNSCAQIARVKEADGAPQDLLVPMRDGFLCEDDISHSQVQLSTTVKRDPLQNKRLIHFFVVQRSHVGVMCKMESNVYRNIGDSVSLSLPHIELASIAMSDVQVIPHLIHHVIVVFVSIDSFVLIITVPGLRWLTQRRYSMEGRVVTLRRFFHYQPLFKYRAVLHPEYAVDTFVHRSVILCMRREEALVFWQARRLHLVFRHASLTVGEILSPRISP